MVRAFFTAGLVSCAAFIASAMMSHAAPIATRRQLGNLECNIDRGEIVFHVADLGKTVSSLAKASDLQAANNTANGNLQAMQDGVQGASAAINGILLGLISNQPADPALRDAVGGNLTEILTGLQDLSSSNNKTNALLTKANQQLTNAVLAGNGVVNNCK
ncbi:uncharacterized protein BXZ73DRAFT_79102 [Epithele typhae]|uniref:uncharacterized protein n=1 Tax=Epithele typhae TaxID=378194 RepID=UPI002008B06F|nr:uncharacterized protein BXZ73DRAFT_79102 [Epithele typhae]KAH9924968.1 hypothetical protein BXZ73DRAFT_79102 [Epithele typhae]